MSGDGSASRGSGRLDADTLLSLFGLVEAVVLRIELVEPQTYEVELIGRRSGEILGLPTDKLLPESQLWALVPPDSRAEVSALVRRIAREGGTGAVEHRLELASRGDSWFRTSLTKTNGDHANVLHGVMLDITELRHETMQSQEVESWLVTLGETLPFDFWICDLDGRCVLQNPVSRERVGDRLGRSTPEWQSAFERGLRGEATREEIEIVVDGTRRHRVRLVSPVRRPHDVHAVLGVEIDVTELKRTEERLRRSLVELHDAQESLVRKKQLAALGEMSATVAHEIRNPLAAMSNALTLLQRRTPPDTEAHALCDIIGDELRRLAFLVANLLDSVRPMNPTVVPTSLATVVEDALGHVLREAASPEGIRVHRIVDARLPLVPMDAPLVELALVNVFRNAIQAMPAGGELAIEIDVCTSDDGAWARLAVADTGPGLPPGLEHRLFEPFVTTRPTGSGLGLAIVRRVMDEHRGRVRLSSGARRGTICVIELPIGSPDARDASDATEAAPA